MKKNSKEAHLGRIMIRGYVSTRVELLPFKKIKFKSSTLVNTKSLRSPGVSRAYFFCSQKRTAQISASPINRFDTFLGEIGSVR
jgi:hypothetical protein